MKIALTGASGLLGSRFFDLLKSKYEIIPIASNFGIDITNKVQINRFLSQKKPSLIIHMAAKTHVDGCELDQDEDLRKLKKLKIYDGENLDISKIDTADWKGEGNAFAINVAGTKNIADYSRDQEAPMIYISTDFVFDGENNNEYTEEDSPNPINWYGTTKLWGEKVLSEKDLIIRTAYPYGYKSNIKRDFVWGIVDLLLKQNIVSLISDQIITPTFIDDIILASDFLIDKKVNGIFNVVGNNFLSPYEIGVAVSREFGLSSIKIEATTREKIYKGRAPRPFKLMLKNDKLRTLGFEMTDFFEALKKIKQA